MQIVSQKFLLIYSSTVSTALAVVILMSAGAHKGQTFDEIDVHRINVVEPDGTLRMVISNKASLPGVIVNGKEQPPNDRPA